MDTCSSLEQVTPTKVVMRSDILRDLGRAPKRSGRTRAIDTSSFKGKQLAYDDDMPFGEVDCKSLFIVYESCSRSFPSASPDVVYAGTDGCAIKYYSVDGEIIAVCNSSAVTAEYPHSFPVVVMVFDLGSKDNPALINELEYPVTQKTLDDAAEYSEGTGFRIGDLLRISFPKMLCSEFTLLEWICKHCSAIISSRENVTIMVAEMI